MAFFRGFINRYPVVIQAFQAGVLMGTGDVLAQTAIEGKTVKELNWKRAAQFTAVGFVIIGPSLRVWYGVLDKYVKGSTKTIAIKKMAFDQLAFAPIFITIVMGSIGLAQGQPLTEINQRLKQDYNDVLLTNYKIWPAVQLCNFYLVPLQYQVLTVQVVAVFWNMYLSWKSNKALKS